MSIVEIMMAEHLQIYPPNDSTSDESTIVKQEIFIIVIGQSQNHKAQIFGNIFTNVFDSE